MTRVVHVELELLHRAVNGVTFGRDTLAAKLATSRRTITRWLSEDAYPSKDQLTDLTRLLHQASATDLARELSEALGTTLVELGLAPSMMRESLLAAFERAAALGLTASEVATALRNARGSTERRAGGPSKASRRAR